MLEHLHPQSTDDVSISKQAVAQAMKQPEQYSIEPDELRPPVTRLTI